MTPPETNRWRTYSLTQIVCRYCKRIGLPGDRYTVRIALLNEGKKTLEVRELVLVTTQNGEAKRTVVKPKLRKVGPHASELLHELEGLWEAGARDWSLEAVVLTTRDDVYQRTLDWK